MDQSSHRTGSRRRGASPTCPAAPRPRRPAARAAALARLAVLVLALAGGVHCVVGPPAIVILSPANGSFTTAGSVLVSGAVSNAAPSGIGSAKVNGISVLPLSPTGNFSVSVPLDPGAIFNPIVAELVLTNGQKYRDRVTLVVGDGVQTGFVLDGDASPESVGMRFDDSGLDQVEPIVEQLSAGALDISGLITGQNPILDDECVVPGIGGGCLYFATANVVEVGIGGFALDADAQAGGTLGATITVDDLYLEIDLSVRDLVALDITCGLELQVASASIGAQYTLEPLASAPSQVDVSQVGPTGVTLSGFQSEFISGVCDAPVIGDIIQLLISPSMIEGLVRDGFASNLGDPDGAGPLDSPIAGAIEQALGGVEIAGPIGQAAGVDFGADFSFIAEDAQGVSFAADARITQTQPLAGAPDLPASYAVHEPFPSFGPLTPVGELPYGLALAISTSAFNQLLKAQTEGGLLRTDVTTFPFGDLELPLTVQVMRAFIPELNSYPPSLPLVLKLRPALAPLMTGAPGPSGELAELALSGLVVELRVAQSDQLLIRVIVDARLGVDLAFVDGALSFTVGTPTDLGITIVQNPLGTNEAALLASLELIFPIFFSSLGDALGSFPLPSFLGLGLVPVEVSRAGDFLALFVDLERAPTSQLANVVVTDLSSGGYKLDGGFDQNEWRHRVSSRSSASSIDVNLKGVVAADACCTTGDKTGSATAAYRVAFDVVGLPGEQWTLDLDHSILGAFTLIDEKVAEQDAGGHAKLTTPVRGSWRLNGGAAVAFDFTPSQTQLVNGVGCTPAILFCPAPSISSGNKNLEFGGSAASQITGTGNASVVLEFSVGLEAFSNSNLAFPAAGGDQAAVRLGKNDTLGDGFVAGAYPGALGAPRNIASDGHNAAVRLSVAPAP